MSLVTLMAGGCEAAAASLSALLTNITPPSVLLHALHLV